MVANTSKIASLGVLSVLAVFAFAAGGMHAASAFTAPPEPWNQCPAVGADTSCGLLIVVNSDGSVSIYASATQGPFDSAEDTLVGVQDNCAVCGAVASMPISGSNIFGLEGDGACSGIYTPNPPAAQCVGGVLSSTDPQDYESSTATFAITDANDGTVNFGPLLTNGSSAWFSLEEPLTATSITITSVSSTTTITTTTTITSTTSSTTTTTSAGVPQFGSPSILVAAVGLVALALVMRAKKSFQPIVGV